MSWLHHCKWHQNGPYDFCLTFPLTTLWRIVSIQNAPPVPTRHVLANQAPSSFVSISFTIMIYIHHSNLRLLPQWNYNHFLLLWLFWGRTIFLGQDLWKNYANSRVNPFLKTTRATAIKTWMNPTMLAKKNTG